MPGHLYKQGDFVCVSYEYRFLCRLDARQLNTVPPEPKSRGKGGRLVCVLSFLPARLSLPGGVPLETW